MDVRELYGISPLQRQSLLDEEAVRLAHAALMSGMVFAMPAELTEASPDGHSATLMSTVQRVIVDPVTGQKSYADHPIAPDVPVHFPGGARTVLTHGLAAKDEGINLNLSRQIDGWRTLGSSQQPFDDVQNDAGDSVFLPGVRSDPRRLQQVDAQAMHARSEDKLHVGELHPDRGHRTFSADPSTSPASDSFDPFTQASKFIDHAVQGASGLLGRAVDGGMTHTHGVTHDAGAFMSALNALHQVLCHPQQGALLSAENGAHTVKATPGGVQISSSSGVSIACPPGTLGLPKGGISGGAVQGGGDISGTLDQAKVTNLANVVGQNTALVQAASDSAAASAGVAVGSLYINTAVKAGVGVLAVRLA